MLIRDYVTLPYLYLQMYLILLPFVFPVATMRMILGRLMKAITTEDTHQYDGWHAYEMCDGLANLAQDYENLKYVVGNTLCKTMDIRYGSQLIMNE